jgi:succinate dehydrogenase / fumarate reductase cytochrome b subunit
VTTAVASDYTAPLLGGRYHFLLRRLHSLTGIVFGGYLVVHLIVNATIAQLGSVYQVQVNKIHDLPVLWALEWGLIYLPILFHTVYGIWITFTGQPNVNRYSYPRNWGYTLQRVSALIIVAFMFFHVFSLKYGWFGDTLQFDPHNASGTIGRHLQASRISGLLRWLVYPIGILASCYHLAYGFWQAAITWGLTISEASQKRWGAVCAGLFILTFVCGMIALVAASGLDWQKLMTHPAGTVHVQ